MDACPLIEPYARAGFRAPRGYESVAAQFDAAAYWRIVSPREFETDPSKLDMRDAAFTCSDGRQVKFRAQWFDLTNARGNLVEPARAVYVLEEQISRPELHQLEKYCMCNSCTSFDIMPPYDSECLQNYGIGHAWKQLQVARKGLRNGGPTNTIYYVARTAFQTLIFALVALAVAVVMWFFWKLLNFRLWR